MPSPAAAAALTLAAVCALTGCQRDALQLEPVEPSSAVTSPTSTLSRSPRPLEDIHNLDLRSQVLADDLVPATLRDAVRTCLQCGVGKPVYTDITKDGNADVVASVDDSTGPAGWVAYTVVDGRPRLIFSCVTEYALVETRKGDVVVIEEMFAPTDKPCCATGPFRTRHFTWNGHTMILAGDTGIARGFAPGRPLTKVTT